jgi:hypothetical protein
MHGQLTHSKEVRSSLTYSVKVAFGVVLDPGIDIVVDEDEGRGAATTESGLETEDSNAILRGLELLCYRCLDFRSLEAGSLGVHQFDSLDKGSESVRKRSRELY